MGNFLTLDTVQNSVNSFVLKWTPELDHNKSRDVLKYLLTRLWDEGRGKLVNTTITLAQTTVARKVGLSRQWVGILLDRLQSAGWIEYAAPWVGPGMRGSTMYTIGRKLKQLLCMLGKSRKGERAQKSGAKTRWLFSPTKLEKEKLLLLQRENEPPRPEILAKVPLLKTWWERGKK